MVGFHPVTFIINATSQVMTNHLLITLFCSILCQSRVQEFRLLVCFEIIFYVDLLKNCSSRLHTGQSPQSSYWEMLEAPIGEQKCYTALSGVKGERGELPNLLLWLRRDRRVTIRLELALYGVRSFITGKEQGIGKPAFPKGQVTRQTGCARVFTEVFTEDGELAITGNPTGMFTPYTSC